jgi:hypothetical protein
MSDIANQKGAASAASDAKVQSRPETMSSMAKGDVERAGQQQGTTTTAVSLWQYLMTDVDPKATTTPLAAYCFMTGYM